MDLIQIVPVIFFSLFGYYGQADAKQRAVWFILAGAAGLFTGFAFYDSYVTPFGMAMGLLFLCYTLFCFALAIKYIFWNEE